MDDSSGGRCGEIASDLSIILVTVVQLIFLVSFHHYIAWPVTGADGSVTRLSLLTDAYSTWLPFPIVASIIVIVATLIMIFYDREWFRQIGWIVFCLCGIAVTTSLLTIWPFDFGVIPDPKAAEILPTALRVLLILMAVFYGISALVLFMQFRKRRKKERTNESNSIH
ncbi:MAG: hypothetical protein GWN58_62705 [Anaerolineae bacterium]|nr:hypothetical protein [Anaerolineae bacterium]